MWKLWRKRYAKHRKKNKKNKLNQTKPTNLTKTSAKLNTALAVWFARGQKEAENSPGTWARQPWWKQADTMAAAVVCHWPSLCSLQLGKFNFGSNSFIFSVTHDSSEAGSRAAHHFLHPLYTGWRLNSFFSLDFALICFCSFISMVLVSFVRIVVLGYYNEQYILLTCFPYYSTRTHISWEQGAWSTLAWWLPCDNSDAVLCTEPAFYALTIWMEGYM